ncbi:MAG: TIGR00730 family Rossman fold protein [Thermoanaerobaculia bacterium]|nr:TIGR00730 family Rossman fold protein [Thermoanaerobaculia bacterium]
MPVSRQKPESEDPTAPAQIARILESPSYRRVDDDPDLLKRDELRPARLQLEYLKPDLLMRDWGVHATIVVFGGTRILEPAAACEKLARAKAALEAAPGDTTLERAVQVAERVVAKSRYYEEARELGRLVARGAGGPGDRRLLVVTGGGPGIMEAANRGAYDEGAPSIGLNITLPHEQFPNPYITPELCFQFRYFALRKMHFLLRARALVAFPGGYGTLDELFDALCLVQTRKIDPLPIVLVGEEFWRGVLDAERLAAEGVIDPEDVELFWYAETAQEAWDGILAWYKNRGEPLVVRANRATDEERR